uniref:adenosylhomocysteinase n=1 Tax=Petunia hybrida TaxID=4102 RepID=Q947H3_PETHY|nr:cytokinin binding protein [Petunia x hybrida]
MAGLMACRTEFGPSQPFKGAKITGSLHMTIQTAVLIETLTALGAEVRWCSCNIFSTQDHAAAAIARDSRAVFAPKGETLQEYWWCTERALDWGPGGGPDLIVDDGGDAYTFDSSRCKSSRGICSIWARGSLEILISERRQQPFNFRGSVTSHFSRTNISQGTKCKSNYILVRVIKILFYRIVTKSKFDNLYCNQHENFLSFIKQQHSTKVAVVAGYGEFGEGCASALKQAGARVIVTEIDPICALQALMEGLQVLTLQDVVSAAAIFVTTTGTKDIIMVHHIRKIKNNGALCNIGHFHHEIDMLGLQTFPGVKRITIKPQTHRWVFPDTNSGIIVLAEGRLINLGCATGHPRFVMSCSFTHQVIAQSSLWKEKSTGKYQKKVYVLPKHLHEKVAALHLGKLGARLTKLRKDQSDYIRVPVQGPYKPAHYRY